MCDKAFLENNKTLKSVPDCCKSQEICNKTADYYSHALEFVPECFMTQRMCDTAVNTYPSTIKFLPECFMSSECVIKQLMDVFFCLFFILFLINIKLKNQYKLKI